MNWNWTSRRSRTKGFDVLVITILILLALWLLVPRLGPDLLGLGDNPGAGGGEDGGNTTALRQLAALELIDPDGDSDAPKYERSEFGSGWADLDGDGCDTRNEILARDLSRVTFKPGTSDCTVQTGTLAEPYLGETQKFVRGQGSSELVQIDHVVALSDAWQSGAWKWDGATRIKFANDPLNLLAVDGPANYEKSALSIDQWIPPNKDFHCEFAFRQVAVKYKWGLSVTLPEAKALEVVLKDCPEILLE